MKIIAGWVLFIDTNSDAVRAVLPAINNSINLSCLYELNLLFLIETILT